MLQQKDIKINIGHSKKNIPNNTDLIIHTSAIQKDNIELKTAKQKHIKTKNYAEAVGELTQSLNTIAICGTHGKTTTTGLTYNALKHTKPYLIIGAFIDKKQNYKIGKTNTLILEACEYKRNFLNYNPTTIVITNIEFDHGDYYKDLEDYISAYKQFIEKLPKNGLLIVNGDDPNIKKLLKTIKKDIKIITYGENPKNTYHIKNNKIYKNKKLETTLNLTLKGKHNKLNALSAYITAIHYSKNKEKITKGLNQFKGTSRRLELIKKTNTYELYDDYAHHPTEIKATLKTLKDENKKRKILVVFQPHQYSRTYILKDQFKEAFAQANKILITDIFEARDTKKDKEKINAEKLAKTIKNATYSGSLKDTIKKINKIKNNYDTIIVMGAGDITTITEKI